MENFNQIVEARRAFRSLQPVAISDELIKKLAASAALAPSCFNKQPWRFVFVKNKEKLEELFKHLSKGNEWARRASLIIAVYSRKEFDCIVNEREYYLFDTGMAVANLLLQATALDLVAHPIAGFNSEEVKKSLNLEKEDHLITLIIAGKHQVPPLNDLSDFQLRAEAQRPPRLSFEEFARII